MDRECKECDCEELTINKEVSIEGHYVSEFKQLRDSDGLCASTLLESLDPEANQSNVFKAGEASGASGSFFFFSDDKKFIVKTMTVEEMHFFLKQVAQPYFAHLKKYPTSLLARIYGVYSVKIQGLRVVNLMLMAHTMQIEGPEKVKRVFDLKGSSVDRKTKFNKRTSSLKTLKDENFVDLNLKETKSGGLVTLYDSEKAFLQRQLKIDSIFLRDLNIMDYSLLLCIEKKDGSVSENPSSCGGGHKDSQNSQQSLISIKGLGDSNASSQQSMQSF